MKKRINPNKGNAMYINHAELPWTIKTSGTFSEAGIYGTVKVPSEKGKYPITIATLDYRPYKIGISTYVKDGALRDKTIKFFNDLERGNQQFIVKSANNYYQMLDAICSILALCEDKKEEDLRNLVASICRTSIKLTEK